MTLYIHNDFNFIKLFFLPENYQNWDIALHSNALAKTFYYKIIKLNKYTKLTQNNYNKISNIVILTKPKNIFTLLCIVNC